MAWRRRSNTPHPTSRAGLAARRDVGGSATFSLKGRRTGCIDVAASFQRRRFAETVVTGSPFSP
jgi:hypothetical protein